MAKLFKRSSRMTNLSPGTLIHMGGVKSERVRISRIDFDQEQFFEQEILDPAELCPVEDVHKVNWINIEGIHQADIIERVGECFHLHPLVLEDIMSTEQRPKIEDYEEYLFVVLKIIHYDEKEKEVVSEHLSLILGSHFVLTFQETGRQNFNAIRDRIRSSRDRIRKMDSDYLAYAIIDSVVDNYFVVLDQLGEDIEDLEDELVSNPVEETLQTLQDLRREIILLRRSVWPLRKVVNVLQRGDSELVGETMELYLGDLFDHTLQIIETIETYRDMLSAMLDIYFSSVSTKMNVVMKVLTIITTIFIPLTFITGLYGMNFKNMPELRWHYGYYTVLGIIFVVICGMLVFFKRKKWL